MNEFEQDEYAKDEAESELVTQMTDLVVTLHEQHGWDKADFVEHINAVLSNV